MYKNKPDAFDDLVGEWIGQVGQLHQEVKRLPNAFESSLAPTRTLLKEAQANLLAQLKAMPAAADKEMGRAGNAAVEALSHEVGRIAQQVAGDVAAAERQKTFLLAIGMLAFFSVFFFGTGLALGGQSMGVVTLVSICFFGGIAVGFGVSLVLPQKRVITKAESEYQSKYQVGYKQFQEKMKEALKEPT